MTTWQEQLRAHGYRLTPQRQLVLEAVRDLVHATPDAVGAHVRERAAGVNISTVYRTLELLEQLGLISHAHLGHGAPTYHPTEVAEHAHLVCRNCQRIIEIKPDTVEPLRQRVLDEQGFAVDVGHLTIYGTCRDCADSA